MLQIAVDPVELFRSKDPELESWLDMVVQRVSDENEEMNRKAKAG